MRLKPVIAGLALTGIMLLVSFFIINGFFTNKKSGLIKSDGLGYYSYLPALFIYGDLTQEFLKKPYRKYYTDAGIPQYMQVVDGKPVDKYFFGTAVLMYPFFMTAHVLTRYFNKPADGYSLLYQYFIGLSAVFYTFVGLVFCYLLLRLYGGSEKKSLLVCVLIAFGTNLFFYATVEPSMSHAYSFAAMSAFLYYCKKLFTSFKSRDVIFAGIALGFIVLIRPVNALIIFALPFLAGSPRILWEGIKNLFRRPAVTFVAALIAGLIVSLQFWIWYRQTGHYIVYSYTYEKFYFDKPHFLQVLFSYQKGFFIYTPLCLVALAGIIVLWKRSRFSAVTLLLFLVAVFYIFSCWHQWYYGGSFGFRPMVEFFPLFAVLLLFALEAFRSGLFRGIFIGVCFFLVYVNQVQAYQYRSFILHWDAMSRYKYWRVFLKTDDKWIGYVWDNPEPSDLYFTPLKSFSYDFDKPDSLWSGGATDTASGEAYSGRGITFLNDNTEYSNTMMTNPDSSILAARKLALVAEGRVKIKSRGSSDKLQLVVSFDRREGGTYFYKSRPIDNFISSDRGYKKFSVAIRLDKVENAGDVIKVYFWNPDKKAFLVDDVAFTFAEIPME
jgi:hypothetical protein